MAERGRVEVTVFRVQKWGEHPSVCSAFLFNIHHSLAQVHGSASQELPGFRHRAWEGAGKASLSFSLSFFLCFSKFLSNLNRTNSNVPVFTAGQTKAALEPSDVVMPPHSPQPGSVLRLLSSIASLLPISAPVGWLGDSLSSMGSLSAIVFSYQFIVWRI